MLGKKRYKLKNGKIKRKLRGVINHITWPIEKPTTLNGIYLGQNFKFLQGIDCLKSLQQRHHTILYLLSYFKEHGLFYEIKY